MNWLLKTEPETYSFADLQRLTRDHWDGVRNFQAAKYIRAMKPHELAFIYHSGKQRAVVGVAEVVSTPYPDPTTEDPRWVVVDVIPKYQLRRPVTLREIKANPVFSEWQLVRNPRLSVMPVTPEYWQAVMELAHR